MNWDEAVRRYARLVMSVPIRYGLSEVEAEEVLQRTWEIALSKCAEPPPPDEIVRYLAATAYWVTRTYVRDSRKRPALRADLDSLDVDGSDPPEEILHRAEREQAVRDALDELSPRDARLVQELFLAQPPLSYVDVAELIGVRLGSVGALRARALARLRRRLGDRGFFS